MANQGSGRPPNPKDSENSNSEPRPESTSTHVPGTSRSSSDATIPAQPRKLDENPRRSLSGRLVYLPGVVVGNDYILNDLLGRGGMGVVFSATHRIMGKKFALKLLAPELMTAENWQRFQREARALSRLSHPSIVQIYNMGVDRETTPFYVMELLEGEPLSQILKTNGPLSEKDALSCFTAIAEALAAAHKQKIIHRDIKPANIVVGRDEAGKVVFKLVDFGLARLIDEKEKVLFNDEQNKQALTALGQVFGSPFYMSPEQCRGVDLDSRTDIYSFGCSLFEALTAHVPLAGETPYETFILHQSKVPPKLSAVCPEGKFSEGIELAVEKMLAKSPLMRYQSMDEILHDFARLNAGKGVLEQTKQVGYPAETSFASEEFLDNEKANSFDSLPKFIPIWKSPFAFKVMVSLLIVPLLFLSIQFLHWQPKPSKGTGEPESPKGSLLPDVPAPKVKRLLTPSSSLTNKQFTSEALKHEPLELEVHRSGLRKAKLMWNLTVNSSFNICSQNRAKDPDRELSETRIEREVVFPVRIVFEADQTGLDFLNLFDKDEIADLEVVRMTSKSEWKKLFEILKSHPGLEILHFRKCQVDSTMYDFLGNRHLKLLDIYKGNFDLEMIARMPSFKKIEHFFLQGSRKSINGIPESLITELQHSKAIRGVKLKATSITMDELKRIVSNHNIISLEVHGLRWQDSDIKYFLSRNLKELIFSLDDLDEKQIETIKADSVRLKSEGSERRILLVESKDSF